jgi:hypothetical protein
VAEKPKNQQKRYLSYLLRLWQEGGSPPGNPLGDPLGEPPLWRASLEGPQSGERLGFASLVELFAYLERETGSRPPGLERQDEGGGQPQDAERRKGTAIGDAS